MDIKRPLFIASILLALLPLTAHAERMNFSYVQLTGLVSTDIESGNYESDGDGLGIRGSWIYGPYVFSDFRYEDVDLNKSGETRTASARLGARTSIDLQSPLRLDVYGMLAFEDVEVKQTTGGNAAKIDNYGGGIVLGARFGPFYPVELGVEYSFTDLGQNDSQFFTIEGIWNAANWLGVVAEYRTGTYNLSTRPDIDRTDFNLGLRWQFGGDAR